MARNTDVIIKQISNGFIVQHESIDSDSWTDKKETYIATVEDVGVYVKIFYADSKALKEKDDSDAQ